MFCKTISLMSATLIFLMTTIGISWGSQTDTMKTTEFKLENGLKLIVREDHRAPVIVTQIWYKVGSADEVIGLTGLSHALEHMMFQGTKKFTGDEFAELISKNGGHDNAFTGTDYTAYYEEMSADKLALTFELEADRMLGLQMDEQAFKNEMQVIKEERRMRTDDKPRSVTYERFMAAANIAGPYHHPIIGWMEDIENYRLDDLKAWYERYYCPNNATLVVVGAVNSNEVYELAKKHFSSIPQRPIQPAYVRQEIPSLGEKRIKVHKEKTLPYLMMGFNVPSFMTAKDKTESYALLVLSGILDGGESARFAKRLVREQEMVTAASAYYELYKRFDSQFMLTAIPTAKTNLNQIESAFWKEIESLKTTPLSENELNKVKAQVIAHQIYDKDSVSEQAISIGLLETIGASWHEMDNLVKQIESLTAEDVQKVANKYFIPERLTVAELIPIQSLNKKEASHAN